MNNYKQNFYSSKKNPLKNHFFLFLSAGIILLSCFVVRQVFALGGPQRPNWPQLMDSGLPSQSGAVVGDIVGDVEREVVAVTANGHLYAWDKNGGLIPGFPIFNFSQSSSAPALGNLDNDASLEIAAVDGTSVKVINGDGSALAGWPMNLSTTLNGVVLADLDKNGQLDLLVSGSDGKVYAINKDGSSLSGWPVVASSSEVFSPVAVGDLDGDGQLEVVANASVVSTTPGIYAWHANGAPVAGFPVATSGSSYQPAIADVVGDGTLKIVTRVENGDYYLVNADGVVLTGWPKRLGTGANQAQLCLGDVNFNGVPDIIAPSNDNFLHVFQRTGINWQDTDVMADVGINWVNIATLSENGVNWTDVDYLVGSCVVGDLNNNNYQEIVVPVFANSPQGQEQFFYVLDNNLNVLSGWPKSTGNSSASYAAPAIAHLDINWSDIEVIIPEGFSTAMASAHMDVWESVGIGTSNVGQGTINPGTILQWSQVGQSERHQSSISRNDAIFPIVTMTAPANNSTVFGSNVVVSATATDNFSVAGVQFKLDGSNLGPEDTTSPYSILFNSTAVSDGIHTLSATARDLAGNRTTASITVTVDNATPPIDTVPPSVSIAEPTDNSTVSGNNVLLRATASDNVAVAGVQFKMDGNNLGSEDTTVPYSIFWDTTTVTNGNHIISAVARDTSNNTATANVTVNVNNPVVLNFNDNFNRANSTVIGNGWVESVGNLKINSNQLENDKNSSNNLLTQPIVSTAQTVAADFASTANNRNPNLGIILRYQNPQNYYVGYLAFGSGQLRISKVVNGVTTVLISQSIANPAQNTFFRLEGSVQGTSLSLKLNGGTPITAIDTTLTQGSFGLWLNTQGKVSHKADNVNATVTLP